MSDTGETQAVALSVPQFAISLVEAKERWQLLQQFVQQIMVQGEDYGTIPGTPKPTLLKPGAEKLADAYGFQRLFEVMQRLEDWDRGLFSYEVKATLVSKATGQIECEGLGSANSREARYRWRWAWPNDVPAGVVKDTLQKREGRSKAGRPWMQYRLENDDPYTLVNTLLKMAKKRALVDAVLSATRSSGIFTQDVEDMAVETSGRYVEEESGDSPYSAPAAAANDRPPKGGKKQEPPTAPVATLLDRMHVAFDVLQRTPEERQSFARTAFRGHRFSELPGDEQIAIVQQLETEVSVQKLATGAKGDESVIADQETGEIKQNPDTTETAIKAINRLLEASGQPEAWLTEWREKHVPDYKRWGALTPEEQWARVKRLAEDIDMAQAQRPAEQGSLVE